MSNQNESAYTGQRVAVFIDGSNTISAASQLDMSVDYANLHKWLHAQYDVQGLHFYSRVIYKADDQAPMKRVIDWLGFNGYVTHIRPVKEDHDSESHIRRDNYLVVKLAVDALHYVERVDHIFMFTGNKDYTPVVDAIQAKGVPVTIVSHISADGDRICADELRRAAQNFIDLADLRNEIAKVTS